MRKPAELTPLPASFYLSRPDVVAPALLGKLIVHKMQGQRLAGRIVEVEAYMGKDDPAAHGFIGPTERNGVLFGPPGRAYVYFIYGMHYCLNVSCEPEGQGAGVLFRALEPMCGLGEMATLRHLPSGAPSRLLTSGPGRLCQALGVTRREHNGIDFTSTRSPLQIVDDGYVTGTITATPRIGIRKAADLPLRFFLEGNRFVSASSTRPLTSTL